MMRSMLGFAAFAVVTLVLLKVFFGLFGAVVGLLFLVLKFALIGFLIYLVLKVLSPSTADRVRETFTGKHAA